MKAWLKFIYTKGGYNCHSNVILINICNENTTILAQSSIVCLDILMYPIESNFFSLKIYIYYLTTPKNLELDQNLFKSK